VEGSAAPDTAVREGRKKAGNRGRLRPIGLAATIAIISLTAACAGKQAPSVPGGSVLPAPTAKANSVIDSINGADLSHPVEETPEQINQYWTDDQQRNAIPVSPEHGDGSIDAQDLGLNVQVAPASPTENVAGAGTVPNSSAGNVWTRFGATGRTVGRLYYTFGKTPYVCSAAVVSSNSKTIVATAAHCLWNVRSGGWASNVLFIPGDTAGKAPYGRWAGARVYVPSQFWRAAHLDRAGHSTGYGWGYDSGFIRMRPLSGANIQTRLGSQGISFNGYHTNVLVLGYPTAAPFDGKTMRYCAINNMGRVANTYSDWSMPCRMTPGASGGPWLASYKGGVGYVVSATSLVGGGRMYSAFWGTVAYQLYQRADKGLA
jgi:V8-like Glu-specific endopeptidase